MAWWVGMAGIFDFRSLTPPVVNRGYPFWFNQYVTCHPFDEILASIRYANRNVNYEDGFLHMIQMEDV